MWLHGLLGGALIGGASALLLVAHGRIAGISGILGGALRAAAPDRAWRVAFLLGLVAAGALAAAVAPHAIGASPRSYVVLAIAGLLVGYGTQLGNGCTSGHGICGLARGSTRSLVAVVTFMAVAAVTATLARLAS
jgi:uncharacterized membrane protein YedE/YeeE